MKLIELPKSVECWHPVTLAAMAEASGISPEAVRKRKTLLARELEIKKK